MAEIPARIKPRASSARRSVGSSFIALQTVEQPVRFDNPQFYGTLALMKFYVPVIVSAVFLFAVLVFLVMVILY